MKDKSPVRLREKKLKDGVVSLYLDIYFKGRRKYEFLGLYLHPNDRKYQTQDKMARRAAKIIVARRIVELSNRAAGLPPNERLFLHDFILALIEKKRKNKGGLAETLGYILPILDDMGKVYVKDIDAAFVKKFIARVEKHKVRSRVQGINAQCARTLSHNTIYFYIVSFRSCLRYAVKAGYLNKNPFDDLDYDLHLNKRQSAREFLTKEELRRMIAAPCRSEQTKRAFLFSCFCGLRYSDICNLKWSDLHSEDGKMVARIRQQKTGELLFLPLSDVALSFLPARKGDKVFDIKQPTTLRNHINKWAKAAGIDKHITFHSARHTFATMAITADIDLYTVSKLLGHTSISTTQIYAKMVEKKKAKAVDALADFFSK